MKKAINLMRDEYDAPWSLRNAGSFFSVLKETHGYMLELQARELGEPEVEYRRIPERTSVLSHIPPRGIKRQIIETCFELINLNEITEHINEKELVEKVSIQLRKKFILTPGNETTIRDYFRKGNLRIENKNGKFMVIDK